MKLISNKILIIVFIALTSCHFTNKKEGDLQKMKEDENVFDSGKWKIVDYSKDGNEKKNLYNGFDFVFSSDHHIIAKKEKHTYTGDWSVLKNDFSDDAPVREIYFNIILKYKNDLSRLSGEWEILKKTNNYLSLTQTNKDGENHLIFEKI